MRLMNGRDAARDRQRGQRRLTGRNHPMNEQRLMVTCLQTRIELGHVTRRPADIEAGNDPKDLQEEPVNS